MESTDAPMTDAEIENETQAKGLTAPRVTLADIEASIVAEYSFTAGSALNDTPVVDSLNRLTFCILVLKNGFTVTGESACVSPENFDAELGRKIARANAIDKCWPLFGFALANRLNPRQTKAIKLIMDNDDQTNFSNRFHR